MIDPLHARRIRTLIASTSLVGLAWICPLAASAQNLLQNGTFDSDLTSWSGTSTSNVLIDWDSDDASGSLSSGSAKAINGWPGVGQSLVQNVTLSGDPGWSLSLQILEDGGGPGLGGVSLDWFGDSGFIDSESYAVGDTTGWSELTAEGVVPAGATSVNVGLTYALDSSGSASNPFRVFFDDVVFEEGPAPPVDPNPNLLQNGDFTSRVQGWSRAFGSGANLDWIFDDATGSPISGAAIIETSSPAGPGTYSQNVVTDRATEPYQASVQVFNAGPAPAEAFVWVRFFKDGGGANGSESITESTTTGQWFMIELDGTIPADTASITMELSNRNLSTNPPQIAMILFDKATITVPEPAALPASASALVVLAWAAARHRGVRGRAS